MNKELLKMADGFSMVAESLRLLAKQPEAQSMAVSSGEKDAAKEDTNTKTEKKAVAVEDIRAVLAQKSQEGKSKAVKELLGKFGAVKLSAVKAEDYPALLQEAKVL